jgi:molybdopterin/thiamine biosynthesis adenylyltransferase
VNRVAARLGVPVVGAALTQWEGQIAVWDPARGAPCYECVFPVAADPGLAPDCAAAGVLGPLPGVLGSMMAVEAVKVLTDAGQPLRGRLMLYDALHAESRTIVTARRADCPVCGVGAGGPRD